MISNLSFMIASLVYIFLLIFIFFRKERVNTPELRLFGCLLVANFCGLALEIMCFLFVKFLPIDSTLTLVTNKIFLVYNIIFPTLYTLYSFSISIGKEKYEKNKSKLLKIYYIIVLISSIIIYFLPLYYSTGDKIYSYGPAVNYIYMYSTFTIILCIISMMFHIKKIHLDKYLSVFFYILGLVLVAIIQKSHPEITLTTVAHAFTLYIMYFTIENPDLKMLNELEFAKRNAELANEAKTDFLSSMSHEIRTPLNAIVGFSNSIMEDKTLEDAQCEAKDIIMASQNLLEIVNGILDISKIEAGKMEIVETEYNLLEILNNISKLIIPRIGEKPIELKKKFGKDIPAVLYGDAGKVREIITNLLTNAVKYTEKGTIKISAHCINEKNKSKLIISVEDTGRGIQADKIDKLFAKFQRLEEDKNTTLEGTGLGLAITKSLVEMMNGKIVVQSEYGSGSKFTVYLEQKIIKMLEETKELEDSKTTFEYNYQNKKILLVDDNALNIKVATRLLKKYEIIPDSVLSGYECIKKLKGNHYDLILMDDMMPNMSGIETLAKLKMNPDFNIPTVVLTANAISGMKEKYLKSGFVDYLSKPIDMEELNRVLKTYLKDQK